MLIQFTVENHRSIKNSAVISFAASKAERKEARLRKGKQWLLTYTGSPEKNIAL